MSIISIKDKGFTLVELLVAIAILTTVIASINLSLSTQLKANHFAKIREEGTKAAQSVLDNLRFEKVQSLPTSGTQPAVSVTVDPSRIYDVLVTFCPDSLCTSNDIRSIGVEVKLKGETVYKTNTVFTSLDGSSTSGVKPTTGSGSCWGC